MPETMPSAVIASMLDTQWNAANVPEPTIVDVNASPNLMASINLRSGTSGPADYLVIRNDTPGFQETPIGNWTYGHRISRVVIDVATMVNRQRLWDLVAEIRRIFHNRMHQLTQYQRIQFKIFNESTNNRLNEWWGRVQVELVNSAVLLDE